LKANKTMVVQASCSTHDIICLLIRPKQVLSVSSTGHIENTSHLVNFSTQIFQHVLTSIHLFPCSVRDGIRIKGFQQGQGWKTTANALFGITYLSISIPSNYQWISRSFDFSKISIETTKVKISKNFSYLSTKYHAILSTHFNI